MTPNKHEWLYVVRPISLGEFVGSEQPWGMSPDGGSVPPGLWSLDMWNRGSAELLPRCLVWRLLEKDRKLLDT